MKTAPLTFTKNTFFYQQLQRTGTLAIYRQRTREGGGTLAFEVVRIRERPDATVKFKDREPVFMEAHEYLPSNEDFGSFGWSYPTLERATAKFDTLLEADATKATQKAAADLAHDERTEGYARRSFRTNPHE